MVFVIKHKCRVALLLLVVLNFTPQIRSDDNAPAGDESGSPESNELPAKPDKANTQETEPGQPISEDEKENVKLEKNEQAEHKKVEIKSDHANGEENDLELNPSNEKQKPEKEEGNEQQSATHDEKSEEVKQEAPIQDAAVASESKKQIQKNDANHKTELNDVNAYNGDGDIEQPAKREAGFGQSELLGLPRDANYFFDDLEPFFNNYTDTRVGRAAPGRDTRIQKTRVGAKVKENLDEDAEEDEEEEVNDEEEKQNDDEYDEDEDSDSDCQPTTACSRTTTCGTTMEKCTTTPLCTEKPKCPKICAKGNKKKTGNPMTSERPIAWEIERKRTNNKKRRHYSKLNGGVSAVI